jgi:peptidyl-prolyl cis-trans isomerase SurA
MQFWAMTKSAKKIMIKTIPILKRYRKAGTSALTMLTLLYTCNIPALKQLDRVIAVVNDEIITLHELETRVSDFETQLKLNKNLSNDKKALRRQVLERMIKTRIQLQQAKQRGITIDDITLNRMLENLAASNKITLKQLRATLTREGVKFDRFREQTRDELIIKQLQQRMVADKVTVSDQEVHQYITNDLQRASANNKYHLHHILIAIPETSTSKDIDKSKNQAEHLYSEIQKGANFNKLAINESDGRNALKGGDLGWRAADELPEVFVKAIATLKKGETSKPVRSASGFHLLKIIEESSNKIMIVQTHARHILIRTDKNTTDDQAQRTLNDIKTRIEGGKDFAELAEEFSQDPGSKNKGGDLGWTDPGQFVAEFDDTINSLKDEQISEPFRSQFGWHLVQVLGRRNQDKTMANIEANARRSIRKRKIDEELRLWLRRIRDEAYVKYTDKSLAQDQ